MSIAMTRHPRIPAAALENKTARIAWVMMSRGTGCRLLSTRVERHGIFTAGVSKPRLQNQLHVGQQVEPAPT
jgi:hypothetical protein